jgi:hypothetical protein
MREQNSREGNVSKLPILLLAVLLCTAAMPAFAGWGRIGTVKFSRRHARELIDVKFKADTLRLTARDGDVFCGDVEVRFKDSRTRTILHDVALTFKKTVRVNLPGGVRNVKQLNFDCWSLYNSRTQVDIAANAVR